MFRYFLRWLFILIIIFSFFVSYFSYQYSSIFHGILMFIVSSFWIPIFISSSKDFKKEIEKSPSILKFWFKVVVTVAGFFLTIWIFQEELSMREQDKLEEQKRIEQNIITEQRRIEQDRLDKEKEAKKKEESEKKRVDDENRIIRENEIKFLQQINVRNFQSLISMLDDIENEKNVIKYFDKNGNIEECKLIQFWNDPWVDIYSDNLNIISKNYKYDEEIVDVYYSVMMNLEAIKNTDKYIDNLYFETINTLGKTTAIQCSEIRKSQNNILGYGVEASKALSVIIVNNYHQFHEILNKKDLEIVENICNKNLLWSKEFEDWLGDCEKIYKEKINFVMK